METVKSNKLQQILNDLNKAVASMKTAQSNPMEMVEVAEIIKKGERKLIKEYYKRMDILGDVTHEIEVITTFADEMGYTLEHLNPNTQPTQPTEPENENKEE